MLVLAMQFSKGDEDQNWSRRGAPAVLDDARKAGGARRRYRGAAQSALPQNGIENDEPVEQLAGRPRSTT